MALVLPKKDITPPVISNGFYKLTRPCETGLPNGSYFTAGTIVEVENVHHENDDREYYTLRFKDESGLTIDYDPHKNGRYTEEDVDLFAKTSAIEILEDNFISEPTHQELQEEFIKDFREKHPIRWKIIKALQDESPLAEVLLTLWLIGMIGTALYFSLTIENADIEAICLETLVGFLAPLITTLKLANWRLNKLEKQADDLYEKIVLNNKLTREKLFNLENPAYEESVELSAVFSETPAETIKRVQDLLKGYGEEEEFHGLYLFHTKKIEDEDLTVCKC